MKTTTGNLLIKNLLLPAACFCLLSKSTIVRDLIGKLEPATGNGYFYINKMSFTGLISVCATYLVIMIQFSPSPSSDGEGGGSGD